MLDVSSRRNQSDGLREIGAFGNRSHVAEHTVQTNASTLVSPDGRYEVVVEETADRFEMLYDTVLVERITGKRLFTCQGTPRTEFAEDGMLNVLYPGYEANGIRIDPARAVFRTHPSEPWVPLAAWPLVEAAYRLGWAQVFDYRTRSQQATFPWIEIMLLLCSAASLLVLSVQTFRSPATQKVLLLIAGAGVLFFGWLAGGAFRWWMQARKPARGLGRR